MFNEFLSSAHVPQRKIVIVGGSKTNKSKSRGENKEFKLQFHLWREKKFFAQGIIQPKGGVVIILNASDVL